jgi:hypothetical protein
VKIAVVAVVLLLGVVGAFGLTNMKLDRSLDTFTQDHAFPLYVEDILRTVQRTLHEPANVLLPRNITRFAPAYTPYAIVLSDSAQKPEDTRGWEIDRFYDPAAEPNYLDDFLDIWEIDYVVALNGSVQDDFLQTNARATFLYKNTELTLYKVER